MGAQILAGECLPNAVVEPGDYELLSDHAKLGCLALWCVTKDKAYPFVFQARDFKGIFSGVQLIYCRDVADVTRFASILGLYLASRRKFLIRIDANGPIPGLPGFFIPWHGATPLQRSCPAIGRSGLHPDGTGAIHSKRGVILVTLHSHTPLLSIFATLVTRDLCFANSVGVR